MNSNAQLAHPDHRGPKRAVKTEDYRSKDIMERILDSAENVLRMEGYAGLSTRRVAQEAGIALGNLTYHFPNKLGLVRALIDRLMTKYLRQFEDTLRAPDQGVDGIVRLLLVESVDAQAMALFREIWSMALHDEMVRECIDDFYDTVMERITQTLGEMYPSANQQAICDLVHLIAAISEGSTVIFGTRRSRASSHEQMIELALRLVAAEVSRLQEPKSIHPAG